MAGDAEKPAAFDQDYGAAVANLRDTTKWIIAAVATTGAGVLVGSQLTKVGALPVGPRLYLAAAGAAVGFCVLGLIYALAVKVISTEEFTIADLAKLERGGSRRARRLLSRVENSMPDGCFTFSGLVADRAALAERADKGDAAALEKVNALDAQIEQLRAPLSFEQKRLRFDDLTRGLTFLAPLLVISVCLFSWAATAPESVSPLSSKPSIIHVASPDGPSTLKGLEADRACFAPAGPGKLDVPVVVVAEFAGYSDVIALPNAPCLPKRVLLKDGRLVFR